MKKADIEIGGDYLIQRGEYRHGWRGRVLREGERAGARSWKEPTKGWFIERRMKNGRKWKPAEGSIYYGEGYDRETGLFFVLSRMIRKPWKQHLADEKEQKERTARAKKIREDRDAFEIERVKRFRRAFGIEARRHSHGGLYIEDAEVDRVLELEKER